jgi:hypothetical protein
LFNGQKKGSQMSKGALRHALDTAVKRSGLKRSATPHFSYSFVLLAQAPAVHFVHDIVLHPMR